MGWFGKLKEIVKAAKFGVDIITLGQATLIEKQIEIAGKTVEATIDTKNMIVTIGEEVFSTPPGEVFFPGVGPLLGFLKNKVEDDYILLNPFGVVPSVDVYMGGILVVGDLIGAVQHRSMFDDEREVARYVFGDSIKLDEITMTNLAGLDGEGFTAPLFPGGATVNMAHYYVHNSHVENIPLLLHELTHVWQLEHSVLTTVQVCKGIFTKLEDILGEDQYSFQPGSQWSSYSTEQQGSIVQAWSMGATSRINGNFDGARAIFSTNSPVFRYINANVRRSNNEAKTESGRSVKQLLADGNHRTVREMLPALPPIWWSYHKSLI